MATGEPPHPDHEQRPYREDEQETRVAARARREPYGEPGPGYGYGAPGPPYGPGPWGGPWGGRFGYGRGFGGRQMLPIETKPFFLTSEFAAVVLAIIGLGITAGASESIDAWRFWILTTVLVSFYVLSRGIAKSGTKSRSADPREDLLRGGGGGGEGRERE